MLVSSLASTVEEKEKEPFPSQFVTNLRNAKLTCSDLAQFNVVHMLRSERQVNNQVGVSIIPNISF